MLKFNIFICLLFLLQYGSTQAQTKASIKGKIMDSLDHSPLEMATVAITNPKDSSLISYTLSVSDGGFILRNLPSEMPIKIMISYVGSKTYRNVITLSKGKLKDLDTIFLGRKMLNEVVIKGERQAIVVKSDTIEFSPEAFKTRPNAVLEDLLKKLPGIQVDLDGSIMVNGQKVKKITIGGKNFFASDLTIASKNINVDLIDKVQVVDDRENDPDKLKDASQLDKIINLTLKKSSIGSVLGKVYAGTGTNGRFEVGGMVNRFRENLQVSLIGFGNNTNSSAFTNKELKSMGWSSSVNFGGIQKIGSGGFNINYDLKKTVSLNLMYSYANTSNNFATNGISETFIDNTTLNSTYNSNKIQKKLKQDISASLEWKVDSATNIRFEPSFSANNLNSAFNNLVLNSNNFKSDLNRTNNSNSDIDKTYEYGHSLTYYHRFKRKDQSVSITNSLSVNPRTINAFINGNSTLYLGSPKDTIQNQEIGRDYSSMSAGFDILYRHPLSSKVITNTLVTTSFDRTTRIIDANNYDSTTNSFTRHLPQLSDDLERGLFTVGLRPGLTWNISKKKSLVAVLLFQWQRDGNEFNKLNRNVTKNYFNILPSLRYSNDKFTASYYTSNRPNQLNDLNPRTINENIIYTFQGNPDLYPIITHSLRLRYNRFIPSSKINYGLSSIFDYDETSIIYSSVINSGQTFESVVNSEGTYNSFTSLQFSKQFKKINDWQSRVSANVVNTIGNRYFIQNLIKDEQIYWNSSFRAGVAFSWKDIFTLEPNYAVDRRVNTFVVNRNKDREFYRHSINTQLLLNMSKEFGLELGQTFSYDQQVQKGYSKTNNLVNASISYRFLKNEKGQFKLTGFDLLNQYNGVSSSIENNKSNIEEQLVLHRYFLMSFILNFNKKYTP